MNPLRRIGANPGNCFETLHAGKLVLACAHEDRSRSVWILECEIFNDAGEVVRRVVVRDGLDQVCTNLNGVTGFVVNDSYFRESTDGCHNR